MSVRPLVAAFVGLVAIALACSGRLTYPRCAQDRDCAARGDAGAGYCVSGSCVVCRNATDCGDREMCRAGACLSDPALQPRDGGEDAAPDAEPIVDEPLRRPTVRRRPYPYEE